MKSGTIKYAVDRKNFLVKASAVLMALSVLFRIIGYWGFWNSPERDTTYTAVFLPVVCCILFIVLLEYLGRAALWTTSIPVFMTAVFLILESSGTSWWIKILSILLYIVAACVYAGTVFGGIRTKWALVVTIGAPLVFHLMVQDRSTLLDAATPAALIQWMPEISAICFLTALLFTALAMEKKIPSMYEGRPDAPRAGGPKYIPPEIEYGWTVKKEIPIKPETDGGEDADPVKDVTMEKTAKIKTPTETRNARRTVKKKRITYICLAAAAVIAVIGVLLALSHSSNMKKYQNYFEDGRQYYESGDYNSAITYLEKAVSLKRTDESILMLADCYAAEGKTEKAIELLEKYSANSSAIKQKLDELKSGGGVGGDVIIGGEKFGGETTSVGLSDKNLKSADIRGLARLTALQSATLSKNQISDLSALSGLKKLEVLDLSDNEITDISPLSGLTSLRTLYLDNNKIKDFSPLYGLAKLTTLSIKGMEITEKQLKDIQDALPDCRIHSEKASEDVEDITIGGVTFKSNVTQLDLSGRGISDISALSGCEELEKLDLRGNKISDITPLMDIPGLKWLCLKNNSISDIRPLMGLTRLTYLDLQNNAISSISSAASLGSLQYLYLGGNKIGSFAPLAEDASLLELGLENTELKDADLKNFENHTNLKKLFLENNPELTQAGVDMLQKTIKNCKISHSALKAEIKLGAKTFEADAQSVDASGLGLTDISPAAGLTKCAALLLGDNGISSISPLAKLTSVKTLDLSNNKISDISPLASMTGLQSLNLEGNPVTDISPLLTMTWLKELYISGADIPQEQVTELYAALPGCDITVEGYTP